MLPPENSSHKKCTHPFAESTNGPITLQTQEVVDHVHYFRGILRVDGVGLPWSKAETQIWMHKAETGCLKNAENITFKTSTV